jgi:hypothetical protein
MQYGVIDLDGSGVAACAPSRPTHAHARPRRGSCAPHGRATARVTGTCGHGTLVDPSVAVHLTLTRHQHRLAGGVGDAGHGQRALFSLAVLVKA